MQSSEDESEDDEEYDFWKSYYYFDVPFLHVDDEDSFDSMLHDWHTRTRVPSRHETCHRLRSIGRTHLVLHPSHVVRQP